MTDTDARLIELAERCEAATGPDRELDIAILTHPAFGYRDVFEDGRLFDRGNDGYWSLEGDEKNGPLPSPTASLDAAMTLVPENCAVDIDNGPSHWICLGKQAPMGRADVKYPKPGYDGQGDSWLTVSAIAKTMPLALCAAALRAIASQETTR